MRLSVSVDSSAVDDIEDAIVDGIEDSLDFGSAQANEPGVPRSAVLQAQSRIVESGAMFNGELLNSFEIDHSRGNESWHVTIENTSDHAAPIEYGAQYNEGRGPPVAALIPWVERKMRGFDLPDDEISDLPEPDVIRSEASEVEYGPDVISMAPEQTLSKAFWLQQHIKEEGIDALRYMKAAEVMTERTADETIASFITKELNGL